MKAIVANVLFAGIFGCLGWIDPALTKPSTSSSSSIPNRPLAAAKLSKSQKLPIIPKLSGSIDRAIELDNSNRLGFKIDYGQRLSRSRLTGLRRKSGQTPRRPKAQGNADQDTTELRRDSESFRALTVGKYIFSDRQERTNINRVLSSKRPYIHQSEQIDLIFGFQNTFWPSQQKQKYWGVTTVNLWGQNEPPPNSSGLNYSDSAPILATGNSALTVSGGGNDNLIDAAKDSKTEYTSEFEEFRGGVSYHHGVAKDLTIGAGFIYDNLLLGFTQFIYDSNLLPIRTTFSLLAKDSQINLHSHVHFEPAPNFVVDYYYDEEKQKFDFNWDIFSGLTLLAKGNSKNKSYSTGIEVALRNDYLSVSATAAFDLDRNLQWKLNSQIGRFKFTYSNNNRKTISELNTKVVDTSSLGFGCSVFVEYQTREVNKEPEEFIVWGSKLQSTKKVGENKHFWTLNLGYGSGEQGRGLVANSAIAVSSDLFLKLNYHEISAVSDDTEIKLELSSQ
jgi:hypothetical protein